MHPKVLDFGISKGSDVIGSMSTGTLTATGSMIGTPYYLAPEQILDSKSAGSQSDQYALGVIFYECLTGKRPYDGDNLFVVFQGIVGGTPTQPRELRPDIPPELEEIVLRAMKSDAKARFATIEDFGRAMLPFASSRARVIWEEAFAVGGSETSVPPGRPSIAVMPTPSPPTRAATLMPPGLAKLPIPGADADARRRATSAAGLKTPTPPPRTIAQWGMSPVPAARPAATPSPATPSPARTPGDLPSAQAVPAAMPPGLSSKSHPVYQDDGLDVDAAPARKSMKGVIIAAVVGAAVVTGVMLFLRGGSDSASTAPAPAAAPAASAPPAAAPAAPPAPAAAAAQRRPRRCRSEGARRREGAPPPEAPPAAPAAKARARAAGRGRRGVHVTRLVQEQEPLARQERRERLRRQAGSAGAGRAARAGRAGGEGGRAGDRLI